MGIDSTNAEAAADTVGKLNQISSRTNLMAIDALLHAIPCGGKLSGTSRSGMGWADAALEASVVARRMAQATADFHASIPNAEITGA